MENTDKSIVPPMDPEQKAHAIKLLEHNDYPRLNAVMNKVSAGKIDVRIMIQAIQDETPEGLKFFEEVLCAEENVELDLEV